MLFAFFEDTRLDAYQNRLSITCPAPIGVDFGNKMWTFPCLVMVVPQRRNVLQNYTQKTESRLITCSMLLIFPRPWSNKFTHNEWRSFTCWLAVKLYHFVNLSLLIQSIWFDHHLTGCPHHPALSEAGFCLLLNNSPTTLCRWISRLYESAKIVAERKLFYSHVVYPPRFWRKMQEMW